MKVKITRDSDGPLSMCRWWYAEHIGEVFEVELDDIRAEYFYTMRELKGRMEKHHIRKSDCEVLEREMSA